MASTGSMIAGEAGITPTFDDILKDLPMHQNFYLRGVFNALLPPFMNPLEREINERSVNGETVEALRLLVNAVFPDIDSMPDGPVGRIDYKTINDRFNLDNIFRGSNFNVGSFEEDVKMSLGTFGVVKIDGRPVVIDKYDFPTVGNWKEFNEVQTPSDYMQAMQDMPDKQMYFGARFAAERLMGDDQDDNLNVNIRIPEQPMVIDVDYDDDPPQGAQDMVLRGPMTNKRKQIWDSFTSMLGEAAAQLNPISDANAAGFTSDMNDGSGYSSQDTVDLPDPLLDDEMQAFVANNFDPRNLMAQEGK
jgi:hypothetical protein